MCGYQPVYVCTRGPDGCFLTILHISRLAFSAYLIVHLPQLDPRLCEVFPQQSRVELSLRSQWTNAGPSLPPNLLLLHFPSLEGRTGALWYQHGPGKRAQLLHGGPRLPLPGSLWETPGRSLTPPEDLPTWNMMNLFVLS